MACDLFISYSRRDNQSGHITQLIERLDYEFKQLSGRKLNLFFDTSEVESWEEWQERILPQLNDSRLFLACLTPSFLESKYCRSEVNEYSKHEIAHGLAGKGFTLVQLLSPYWGSGLPGIFRNVRRRIDFDLRGWFNERNREKDGELVFRINQLTGRIVGLIRLIERSEDSSGNVDPFNPHFVGRRAELERIHDALALDKLCVLSGRDGIGKTALAVEYAHAFADEYGGGRWQVSCQDQLSLRDAIAKLARVINVELGNVYFESRFDFPLSELHKLAMTSRPQRCLLILDNVTGPELLERWDTRHLLAGSADWLHVIATTRSRAQNFPADNRDQVFLELEELPRTDAIDLIESFQPGGSFAGNKDREAAQQIVAHVGGFTLAVETAAVCLGYRGRSKTLNALASLSQKIRVTEDNQEKSLAAIMRPIVLRMCEPEKSALRYTLFFGEQFELSNIRHLVAQTFMRFERDAEQGYASNWQTLVNNLFTLRWWQPTHMLDENGEIQTARMHPLLRPSLRRILELPDLELFTYLRTNLVHKMPVSEELRYEGIGPRKKQFALPHPLDENVMFTIYRRKAIAPNKWYPLLAFAHLSERRPDAFPNEPDPLVEVRTQARGILGSAIADYKKSSEDSSQPIPKSGELMFKPHVPGIEFNPASRTFKWEEPVHREEFKMRATGELEGQVARGWLSVFLGPIIVAEINLTFAVNSNAVSHKVEPDLIDQVHPFRKIFASYSHKDNLIVEHIERLVRDAHLGLEYLRDVTKLRAGEVWNDSLLQMIDAADIFQLFWSTNSMYSEYVKREYKHALARRLPGFVRPVYWEKPFPERPEEGLPPEELKCLHFEELSIPDVPPSTIVLGGTGTGNRVDTRASKKRESRVCRNCGRRIPENTKFCPDCQVEMFYGYERRRERAHLSEERERRESEFQLKLDSIRRNELRSRSYKRRLILKSISVMGMSASATTALLLFVFGSPDRLPLLLSGCAVVLVISLVVYLIQRNRGF